MAQIQGGTTYADGGQVTATNLNAHVNNAVLVPGAISDQTAAGSVATGDTVLVLQSGALKKATLSQVQAAINPDLSGYLLRDGSQAMTGELTLSSSAPSASLSAASKGYVDTGLAAKQNSLGFVPVNKAGDTMTGALTLAADPASNLQAATKQYVDTGLATKQNSLGFTPVNKAGDTGVGALTLTGALTLPADPASALQASTKQYVDTQVANAGANIVPAGAIMAFYRSTPPTGWLECNGQSVAAYPNLVALGLTNAPDLRGEFVRGWDNARGVDPGRVLGSTQADIIKDHTHALGLDLPIAFGGTSTGSLQRGSSVSGTGVNATQVQSGGGSETRPRNIALMYCIKT